MAARTAAASGGAHNFHHAEGAAGRSGCPAAPGISRTFLKFNANQKKREIMRQ